MLQRDPSYGFLLIYHLIAECQIIYNIYVIIIYEIYVVYRSILQCLIIFPHLLYLFPPWVTITWSFFIFYNSWISLDVVLRDWQRYTVLVSYGKIYHIIICLQPFTFLCLLLHLFSSILILSNVFANTVLCVAYYLIVCHYIDNL